jgi:hypothetical protein
LQEINMADNTQRTGSPDSKRINVNQPYELRGWAKSLGVSEEHVCEAVRAVGDSANKVKDYLAQKARGAHPTSNQKDE